MAVGVGGGGFLGIALEATSGAYAAPTKFFPITNESLQWQQDTVWRRPIRQTVDVLGAVPGNGHVEGDIVIEGLADVLPYFHRCSRATVVKTGAGPFTYTFTPSPAAQPPDKTMSVTVVRNGQVFGYVGCAVSSFEYSIEGGMLQSTFSMLGNFEVARPLPLPTFSTQPPIGAGSYVIQIPTLTDVFDMDGFTFGVDDNADPQFRLKNVLGAHFIQYGERSVTLSTERDFETRADYDSFKALTAQGVLLRASTGPTAIVELSMPSAIKDSYDIALDGQGDLLRASVSYQGIFDPTLSRAYQVAVTTSENII